MQKVTDDFKPMIERNLSSPFKIAEVILYAILSTDPEIRYLAGNDAFLLIENRKKLSNKEFDNWIKEHLLQRKGFVGKRKV